MNEKLKYIYYTTAVFINNDVKKGKLKVYSESEVL